MMPCVFLIVYAALHLVICSFNYLRYGEFCIAKLGDAHLPFYRLFVQEHVISPSNGPASRQLAELVDTSILTSPVYAQYEITHGRLLSMFYAANVQFADLYRSKGSMGGTGLPCFAKRESNRSGDDPGGSFFRYVEHLVTVFDYGDQKPFKISNLRDLGRAFVRNVRSFMRATLQKVWLCQAEGDLVPSTPLFVAREGRRRTTGSWAAAHGEGVEGIFARPVDFSGRRVVRQ